MSAEPKTLILTGASRGIGHATVKRFSDEGWKIVTCSREPVPDECKLNPSRLPRIRAKRRNPADCTRFEG